MAKNKVAVEMTVDDAKAFRAWARQQGEAQKLERGYDRVAGASKRLARQNRRTFQQADAGAAKFAVGLGSILAATRLVVAGLDQASERAKRLSEQQQQAAADFLSLAALQEPGQKLDTVRQALKVGQTFGITDRGSVTDIFQAMQSIQGGSRAKAQAASEQIFAAFRGQGIPLEFGKELEVLGQTQLKQAPGVTIRQAARAGELSGRDPRTIGGASAALPFFQDPNLAFAAAAVVSEAVKPEELGTFLKQAGKALDIQTSDAFLKFRRKAGISDEASQFEVLKALTDLGLESPRKLKEAGLNEQKQAQSLSALVKNFDKLEPLMREIAIAGADEQFFFRKMAGTEAELPQARHARRIAMLDAMGADIAAGLTDDPRAQRRAAEARRQAEQEAARAVTLRRQGVDSFLGFDIIGEDNRVGEFAAFLGRLKLDLVGFQESAKEFERTTLGGDRSVYGRPPRDPVTQAQPIESLNKGVDRVFRDIGDVENNMLGEAAKNLNNAAAQQKGGPTLVPTNEDL